MRNRTPAGARSSRRRQSLHRREVGLIAAGKDTRLVFPQRDGGFRRRVLRREAGDQSRRPRSGAQSIRAGPQSGHDARMMRQSQIIIRAEIDANPPVDLDMHRVDLPNRPPTAKQSRFGQPRQPDSRSASNESGINQQPARYSSSSSPESATSATSPASSPIAAPVIFASRCFINRPTLNLTVCFSGTSTGSSVLGFWAFRALRILVSKTPKSRNSRRLPLPNSSTIWSRNY